MGRAQEHDLVYTFKLYQRDHAHVFCGSRVVSNKGKSCEMMIELPGASNFIPIASLRYHIRCIFKLPFPPICSPCRGRDQISQSLELLNQGHW